MPPVGQPVGPNPPTVDYTKDRTWLVPAELPAGMQFDVGIDYVVFDTWTDVRYTGIDDDRTLTIRANEPGQGLAVDSAVDIDGVTW